MDSINSNYFLKPDPVPQPEAKPQPQGPVETSANNSVESTGNSGKKRKKEEFTYQKILKLQLMPLVSLPELQV